MTLGIFNFFFCLHLSIFCQGFSVSLNLSMINTLNITFYSETLLNVTWQFSFYVPYLINTLSYFQQKKKEISILLSGWCTWSYFSIQWFSLQLFQLYCLKNHWVLFILFQFLHVVFLGFHLTVFQICHFYLIKPILIFFNSLKYLSQSLHNVSIIL